MDALTRVSHNTGQRFASADGGAAVRRVDVDLVLGDEGRCGRWHEASGENDVVPMFLRGLLDQPPRSTPSRGPFDRPPRLCGLPPSGTAGAAFQAGGCAAWARVRASAIAVFLPLA